MNAQIEAGGDFGFKYAAQRCDESTLSSVNISHL